MLSKFFKRLALLWNKYNPFDISDVVDRMVSKFDTIEYKLDNLKSSLETEINFYKEKAEFQKALLDQIGDSLPDGVWCKDLECRYIYANSSIRGCLLLNSNPIGKTDKEIYQQAKLIYGEDNFTFGDKDSSSDLLVLKEERPMRFLVSGKIKGKMSYFEVHKNVVRDPITGKVVGLCGTSRDLTEYVEAVKLLEEHGAKRCREAEVVAAFKKYNFEEGY